MKTTTKKYVYDHSKYYTQGVELIIYTNPKADYGVTKVATVKSKKGGYSITHLASGMRFIGEFDNLKTARAALKQMENMDLSWIPADGKIDRKKHKAPKDFFVQRQKLLHIMA